MSFLDNIKKRAAAIANDNRNLLSGNLRQMAGGAVGTLGTILAAPELNWSERIAKPAYAAESQPTPSPVNQTGSSFDPNAYRNQLSGNATYIGSLANLPSGGGGGGGGNNPTPAPTGDQNSNEYQQWAAEEERKKQARMQAIVDRLNAMRGEADRLRGSAKSQYDFSNSEIDKNYGKLKTISGEKRKNSLASLDQADIDTQNVYGKASGNAVRAMESALTRNRMLHRALGSLGSSFYSNDQGDTTNQGSAAVADIGAEQASKRSGIASQKGETNTYFDTQDVGIESEATKLKNDALNQYNNAVAAADLMQKQYGIDSEEELNQAYSDYTANLGKIQDYVQNKSVELAKLAAANGESGAYANAIKGYNWKSPQLEGILNQNAGLTTGSNFVASAGSVGQAPVGDASNYTPTQIAKIKKQLQDPNGYIINPFLG